jgi:hypothetical protein
MSEQELVALLRRACDVMRRLDPNWCALQEVEQTTDDELTDAVCAIEDALDVVDGRVEA